MASVTVLEVTAGSPSWLQAIAVHRLLHVAYCQRETLFFTQYSDHTIALSTKENHTVICGQGCENSKL